jgi:hypothetical protein
LLRGEDRLARGRGGWGVNILEDERNRIALLQKNMYSVVGRMGWIIYIAVWPQTMPEGLISEGF